MKDFYFVEYLCILHLLKNKDLNTSYTMSNEIHSIIENHSHKRKTLRQLKGKLHDVLCSRWTSLWIPGGSQTLSGYITVSVCIPIQCTEVPWASAAGFQSLSLSSGVWPHQVISCLRLWVQWKVKGLLCRLSFLSRQKKVVPLPSLYTVPYIPHALTDTKS